MRNGFKNTLAGLAGKIGDDALVIIVVLLFKADMQALDAATMSSDLLAFVALGGFLSLRLLRAAGLPKD